MQTENWINICPSADLVNNSGVCALVNGKQIAIFKVSQGNQQNVYAISNWDPIGQANVMYRGLIGSIQDTPFVASPLYKQRFCLQTGHCVDVDGQGVEVFPARIVEQDVQLCL